MCIAPANIRITQNACGGKNNVCLEITEEDRQALKQTVDFISFSYYSSKVVAADESRYTMANGNIMRGLKNPYVPVSITIIRSIRRGCATF